MSQLGGQALRLLHDRWRAALLAGPSCRRALRRVAVLVLISVLSVVVAWLAWDALLDRRLRLGGSALTTSAAFSLEAKSTTRQLEADLAAGGGSAEATPGSSDGRTRARTGPAASGGGGFEIDGHVLGGLAAGVTLGTGGLVGRIVLRRLRDESHPVQELARDGHRVEHEDVDAETSEGEDGPGGGEGPAGSDGDEADDLSSEATASVSADPVLDPSARLDADQAVDRQGETKAPVLDDPGKAMGSPPEGPVREVLPQPVYEARERVYERRRAPRVAVQLEGQLQWRGGSWPVTVLDLSDSGLRLTLARRPSVPGRQAPLADGDHVKVSFEAASAVVEVSGQVAWQRAGPTGCELGILFGALPGDDLDLVLAACAEHGDPAPTSGS